MEHGTDTNRRTIALEYLRMAHVDLVRASRLRVERIKLARQYGATNQQIADECGITEAAVRGLLARHGGA